MEKKASAAIIAAGCLWGIINIFVKKLSAAGLGSMQISLVRVTVSMVIFSAITFFGDRPKFRIRLRDLWMFIGTGIVSLVLFNSFYFYAMIHGQASVAVILLYTSPIFVMLMSAVLFKEKITPVKLIALAATFMGCVLVSGVVGGSYVLTLDVLAAGLASGFLYALYSIFGRYALQKYDPQTVSLYTFIFAFLGSLPLGKPLETLRIGISSPETLLLCIGIGIACTIIPYVLYTWGLRYIESGKAAILVAVEPLVGAVIGIILFHESHDLIKIVGIVCIFAAIVMLGRAKE
ncbi:MAG: DMT family transporter [Lachnospiraceae bacterium]|jgi:DME family drug/metabolite transporter